MIHINDMIETGVLPLNLWGLAMLLPVLLKCPPVRVDVLADIIILEGYARK
jgi:hypothetical protein